MSSVTVSIHLRDEVPLHLQLLNALSLNMFQFTYVTRCRCTHHLGRARGNGRVSIHLRDEVPLHPFARAVDYFYHQFQFTYVTRCRCTH